MEEWRTIEWASAYAVSDQGRVKRVEPDWQGKYAGRMLKPAIHRGGYRAVTLCLGGGSKRTVKVHRLVCEAFHGPAPSFKHHGAHADGDPANNLRDNLYWATPEENAADRERHGRTARGAASGAALHPEQWKRGDAHWTRQHPERVPRGHRRTGLIPRGADMAAAKLTEAQAQAILNAPQYHGVGRDLAERYGVSMGLITAIRKGRAWKHLTPSPRGSASPPPFGD